MIHQYSIFINQTSNYNYLSIELKKSINLMTSIILKDNEINKKNEKCYLCNCKHTI
jgi:L-rhamnose mutarotase